MKSIRNIGLALVAGSALMLGSAYAQDAAKKPEAKPEAKHQHRGMHGMAERHQQRMGKMHGCPAHEPRGASTPSEHDHS